MTKTAQDNAALVEVRCLIREMVAEVKASPRDGDVAYYQALEIILGDGKQSPAELRARITAYKVAIKEGNKYTPVIKKRMEEVVKALLNPPAQEQPKVGARTKAEAMGKKPRSSEAGDVQASKEQNKNIKEG